MRGKPLALFSSAHADAAEGDTLALPEQGGRIAGDRYYTPPALASACVAALAAAAGGELRGDCMEPHTGGGAFARAIAERLARGARLVCSDLDPAAPGLQWARQQGHHAAGGVDFLSVRPGSRRWNWIIGNPPYDAAEAHARRALRLADNVALLLRLAFVESSGRVPFWARYPARHIWALAARPSFSACGRTDSAAYGLFWWDQQWAGPTTITPGWDWRGGALPPAR